MSDPAIAPGADPRIARIEANPTYQALRRERNVLGWVLTAIILVAYYGFIGLIAFDKEFLARPLGTGVTSIGIPIAMGVIVLTIALTALYVFRANRHYDKAIRRILEESRA
ncbi:MAG: DUF485 domain-containing protein [Pseudoxanthomonas suwonensis]|nr:DUF485 domain-containing protein [Pseudoxanthomonas suwonensis]